MPVAVPCTSESDFVLRSKTVQNELLPMICDVPSQVSDGIKNANLHVTQARDMMRQVVNDHDRQRREFETMCNGHSPYSLTDGLVKLQRDFDKNFCKRCKAGSRHKEWAKYVQLELTQLKENLQKKEEMVKRMEESLLLLSEVVFQPIMACIGDS